MSVKDLFPVRADLEKSRDEKAIIDALYKYFNAAQTSHKSTQKHADLSIMKAFSRYFVIHK